MSFEAFDLDPKLLKNINSAGYTKPTQVQQLTLPAAMEQRDLLVSAPTGTGKTAAYLLPALQHLLDFPRKKAGPPRILVLVPTRELAQQVLAYAQKLAQDSNIDSYAVIGGVNYGQHAEVLRGNCDLLIATPGRLLEYINAEVFDCRAVEMLILDEADRMLDMGFRAEMERIADETRWRKQTLLFSATLELSDGGVEQFARSVLNDPLSLQADPPLRERGKIRNWYHLADDWAHKVALLEHYLADDSLQQAIVFVKSRDQLDRLSQRLQQAGVVHSWLRGEMAQHLRNNAIQGFSSGAIRVLLATDVAARGLDIPNVSHVFNFDLPRTADVFVHRIGRTARGGKKGTAIALIEHHDLDAFERIQHVTSIKFQRRVVESLKPQSRFSANKPKKKKLSKAEKTAKTKTAKPKVKQRKRDQLNKGAPKRLRQKAAEPNSSKD